MGKYINCNSQGKLLPATGKASALIDDGATVTLPKYQDNLICVVENGDFDAAAWIYSEEEFNVFNDSHNPRIRHWLIHPKASELAK